MNQMTQVEFKFLNPDQWYTKHKLPDHIINYLWDQVNDVREENLSSSLSSSIEDPDNIMIDEVFKGLFNSNLNRVFVDYIQKYFRAVYHSWDKPSKPVLDNMWVNFQKKYQFNPLHEHAGMFSFVIWMKIPYDWKDEKELPWVKGSSFEHLVGNFCFVDHLSKSHVTFMNKQIEGYCAFFPSQFHHMVYPFYTSDEERVTISGNIYFELEQ
jgi:hypothetical protein